MLKKTDRDKIEAASCITLPSERKTFSGLSRIWIVALALLFITTIASPINLGAREKTDGKPVSTTDKRDSIKGSLAPASTQYPVGYTVVTSEYEFKDQKAPYKIAIWYPSAKKPGKHIYKIGPSSISTNVAVDAPVPKEHFPILFYSHGATGSGTSSFFICELLARNGYIVVAPDYLDTVNAARIDDPVPFDGFMKLKTTRYIYWLREFGLNKASREGRTLYSYRPEQLKKTMDKIMSWNKDSKSNFHDRIDEERIGLFGHSFGAWTSLLVSGAAPTFFDKRIKAVVALSGPVNDFVYKVETDNDLKPVNVPILFEFGEKEPALGRRDDKSLLYEYANAPKMLISIKDADHLSFSGGIKGEHKLASEYLDDDPQRKTISETTLDFFDAFLRNNKIKQEALKSRTDGVAFSVAQF